MTEEIEADGPVKRSLFMFGFIVTDVVLPLAAIIGCIIGAVYVAGSVLVNVSPWIRAVALVVCLAILGRRLWRAVV